MATFTITNLTSNEVHLGDFYKTLAGNEVLVLEDRSPNEVPDLKSVIAKLAAGSISFSVDYTAEEISTGMMSPPNAVEAQDFQQVAAADVASPIICFRKEMVAGGGGAPDDVEIFAAGALPYTMRVLDVIGLIDTAVVASTLSIRDEAAGAGTESAALDSGSAGRVVDPNKTVSAVYTPGATKGLFIRRSDNGVAGEVQVYVRREG